MFYIRRIYLALILISLVGCRSKGKLVEHSKDSLLHRIQVGYLSSIEKYLEVGGDPDIRLTPQNNTDQNDTVVYKYNIADSTPLMIAASNGNMDLVQLLIAGGSDINLQDKHGLSALMIAVISGYYDITELLLDNGARLDLKANNGQQAVHMIYRSEKTLYTLKMLLEKGADIDATWHESERDLLLQYFDRLDVLAFLLDEGLNVDHQLFWGRTILIRACRFNDYERVELFLKHGANVNLYTDDGKTALDYILNIYKKCGEGTEKARAKKIIDALRKHGAKTGKELGVKPKDPEQGGDN